MSPTRRLCRYHHDEDGEGEGTGFARRDAVVHEVKDQFYGDRSGTIADPFGHVWTIGTHVEDVSPEEMARRMAQLPQP